MSICNVLKIVLNLRLHVLLKIVHIKKWKWIRYTVPDNPAKWAQDYISNIQHRLIETWHRFSNRGLSDQGVNGRYQQGRRGGNKSNNKIFLFLCIYDTRNHLWNLVKIKAVTADILLALSSCEWWGSKGQTQLLGHFYHWRYCKTLKKTLK